MGISADTTGRSDKRMDATARFANDVGTFRCLSPKIISFHFRVCAALPPVVLSYLFVYPCRGYIHLWLEEDLSDGKKHIKSGIMCFINSNVTLI